MLKQIREDSQLGIQAVRNSIKGLMQRSMEEAESIKLRLEIRRKEKQFDELTLRAGKMLFEKLQKGDSHFGDPDLKNLFLKALQLKEDIEILKTDLSERLSPIV